MLEETKPLLQRLRETGRDLEHTLAAYRIAELENALREITNLTPDFYSKHDLYTAKRIAKEALDAAR